MLVAKSFARSGEEAVGMSRIGKTPVVVPAGTTVSIDGAAVSVKGTKGELSWTLPEGISASVEGSEVVVTRATDKHKSFHGLSRSLVANMVEGCTNGFTKTLTIEGVGFRAEVKGKILSLLLGFASAKEYPIPDGVTITVNNNTEVVVNGPDKQLVGLAAARVRSYYPAEPYKGKGVRYKGEKIRRKVGKTVA
jgi:large subunit ribosomal protein L6